MTCERFVAQIRARLNDELSGRPRAQFDRHAAACERCSSYLAAYEQTIRLARDSTEEHRGAGHREDLAEDLVQSIMDEIRKAKNPS
jgi:anti-sigma factor RsiW